MERGIFYRQGKITFTYRWPILFCALILTILCLPFLPKIMTSFNRAGFNDPHSESYRAIQQIDRHFNYGENKFIIVYESTTLLTSDPKFMDEIDASLSELKNLPFTHHIIYPYMNTRQISPDKRSAYVTILLKGMTETDPQILSEITDRIKKPPHLRMTIGGNIMFAEEAKKMTQADLFRAEYLATPLALVAMLIIFGTVVAGVLPVIMGSISVLFSLSCLYFLGHFMEVSLFSLNIAVLLSLGLNLDYSLFVVGRFREELEKRYSIKETIQVTQYTAGKAIFFSVLSVVISLSALLLFRINFLISVGIGGIIAVSISGLVALFLLPSVLAIIGKRIYCWPVKLFSSLSFFKSNHWESLINKIIRHPLRYASIVLVIIFSLSMPVFKIHLNLADPRILPKTTSAYQVFDFFHTKMQETEFPIIVLVTASKGNISDPGNIYYLYDFAHEITKDPRVKRIESIVTKEPRLTKNQLQELYAFPEQNISPTLLKYFQFTTRKNMTLMTIVTKHPANSKESIALVQKIRRSNPGNGLRLQVTGFSANLIDVFKNIGETMPYAILWILCFTYLILLFLFRSLLLPVKAILMNLLSLAASYGVLVFIFQEGYFSHFLGFEPLGYIELTSVIVIFCALFGISMDYEVFMLSRIKECYEKTKNTPSSIIMGTIQSGKIVSGAALVLIVVCISFLSAEIILVKVLGLGVSVAILVDAFLIRIFLVPASMSLFAKWNWYLPRWIEKHLPDVSFHHE